MNRKYSMIFLKTVLFSKSSDIKRFPSRHMVFKISLQFCNRLLEGDYNSVIGCWKVISTCYSLPNSQSVRVKSTIHLCGIY